MTKPNESPGTDPPRGIGAPATRALTAAGYTTLEELAGVPESELLALHGVGPGALTVLREVMAERGLSFR
ncbi:DNA-binding protein [Streptomyces vilmorinianum]|uniref:DNA-binding protein n=1 Tax=Streptomyces vilmorinianum TaxID=3051092 RepID=UPI0010FBB0B1|nr:DNA-binding protein [Streptomyces vilmorinianum]